MPRHPSTTDLFARARIVASAGQMLAGALAIAGVFLDWVRITARPELAPGADFGDAAVEAPRITEPFNGLDVGADGWWVLAGGVILILSSLLVLARARGGWYGFIAAMVVGAVAFADYRGIDEVSSSIGRRMDIVGGAAPGIGLTAISIAGVVGVVASVAAIAASPRTAADDQSPTTS
ncbi:MAG: hypothetical protein ABR575_06640 [Actinomycetota bacterium]